MQDSDHIHLIGICGTAMASMAGILKQRGHRVTGSDSNCYPPMSTQLAELGIEVKNGYVKENLIPAPDLVIVGNVIQKKFEEAQYLLSSGIPYTSLPKAMAEFVIEDRKSIVMTGTHGKTTTTSMMAWVMSDLGLQPGYMIGGIANNFGKSFENPKSDWFVIEGDEYDTAFFDKVPKFIYYKPKFVTITSIEFDHADIYSDIGEILQAFDQLVDLVPEDGHILAFAGSENIDRVIKKSRAKVFHYGIDQGEYQARDIKQGQETCTFNVFFGADKIADIELPMSGRHNVLNALSVVAHAHLFGWDLNLVSGALSQFKGVKRRQELLGTPDGVRVIEDFAHHPSAVATTLAGLKEQYSEGKLFAVFEPRSATSRRGYFQQQYAEAFLSADFAVIAKPYNQSGIDPSDRFSSEKLVADLEEKNVSAMVAADTEVIVEFLVKKARQGDTIVIMSNGGFDGIFANLMERLESRQS